MKRAAPMGVFTTLATALLIAAAPANAQDNSESGAIARLEAQIKAQEERIQELERLIGAQVALSQPVAVHPPTIAGPTRPAQSAQLTQPASTASPVFWSGDFRVRVEGNFYENASPDRVREVVRGRLRARYAVSNWLTVGAQLSTGDPGDPNTADVTLSNFVDDLQVSLDQAYLAINHGGLELQAGKFPLPFTSTEMAWDGDVSPQGVSAAYTLPLNGPSVKLVGIYSVVNEVAAGDDSRMLGGQLRFDTGKIGAWKGDVSLAYFDYDLVSIAGADAGDFRGNRLTPAGRYLSDFDLSDVIVGVSWSGLGEAWPVRMVADYVRNSASSSNDDGHWVDLKIGAATADHPWRFGYGFAEVETDAVLAAFSHDNLDLSTNYRQHAFTADYTLSKTLSLNATYYHYQALDVLPGVARGWSDRIRLNLLASF